jgi:prepilin-type N-terminal cleavage/methylation domain-containing protein
MTSQRRKYSFYGAGVSQKGMTLVELLVSIAVTTVLMLAIGSAMLIAAKAMPDANGPANQIIVASEVAEQLAAELQYATTINDSNATVIDFTVADRNADEVAETIRYQWSGTVGDPLTRQYNAGTAVAVMGSVQELNLSYDIEVISEEIPTENESAETLLADYNSFDVFNNPGIQEDLWCGQYIIPSLPADTISWRVTQVAFYACSHAKATGEVGVELQLPTGGNVPDGVALESKTLLESSLTADFTRQEFSFSNVLGLSPDQGICLVFRWMQGPGTVCVLQGQDQNNKPENGNLVESTDQGASWPSYTNRTLLYEIYGTVTTPGTPVEQTYYLRTVNIRLRAGDNQQSAVYTAANTLNKPEVTP